MPKLTVVLTDAQYDWLKQFARDRQIAMGEVVRQELEALYQNEVASAAAAAALAELDRVEQLATV